MQRKILKKLTFIYDKNSLQSGYSRNIAQDNNGYIWQTQASVVAQLVKKIHLQCRWPWFYSWIGKDPWRRDSLPIPVFMGFLGGSDGKESICNVGDLGSIPGLGRSPGGGHGNPLQYSCLENLHRQRSPWGHREPDMTEQLSTAQHTGKRHLKTEVSTGYQTHLIHTRLNHNQKQGLNCLILESSLLFSNAWHFQWSLLWTLV